MPHGAITYYSGDGRAYMKVDFENIECRSAFDLVGRQPTSLQFQGPSPELGNDVRVAELTDVLYLPSVLEQGQSICVVDQRFIPKESVLDCWSVAFFKESKRDNPAYQRTYAAEFDVAFFPETACILGNLFSRNFTHWTEELLKVAVLETWGTDFCYVIPDLPAFAKDFLGLLGVRENRVVSVNRPTVFARAIFSTAINHDNISNYPFVLSRLRDLVQSHLGSGSSRYGPRLWLERGEKVQGGGVTLNKNDVYQCIEKYGFDIVDMATLPLSEQLKTVRHATVIAGPHGSQFAHAQFMPMSSAVVECFSPMHVNPAIFQICRALNHSYHQIVSRSQLLAPYPFGRDCQVDCEHLSLVLSRLLT